MSIFGMFSDNSGNKKNGATNKKTSTNYHWRCNYCGASRTLSYRPMAGECGARPKKSNGTRPPHVWSRS